MILRFVNAIQDFARENNLECEFDFSKNTNYERVYCTFCNPVTKKYATYDVAIADEEDLDGTIDIIKEDVKEELVSNDEENSLVFNSKEA